MSGEQKPSPGGYAAGMAHLETRVRKTVTTYRITWREDGTRQQITLSDPLEAQRFKQLVEGSGNRWPAGWTRPTKAAPPQRVGKLTFGHWAETAIGNRTRASERAKEDYRRDVKNHMAALIDVPLAEVGDEHVARWLEDLAKAGLAAKTIRNLHGLASSFYTDALRQRPPLCEHNPMLDKLRDSPTVRTEEMVFLTPQEFAVVHGNVRDEYADLIRFLAGTGARFGEATALQVRDVDLLGKRPTVAIHKAWKRTGTSSWVVGEPKTPRSRRTVSIGAELVDMLIPHTSARQGGELLFPGAAGGRLPHTEVYKRGWAPAVAAANVCATCLPTRLNKRGKEALLPAPCDHDGVLGKQPRIHDLRHSHVSWLIAEGIPIAAISRRLGHSSIQITIDRYGHLDPALDATVNAAADRALARR